MDGIVDLLLQCKNGLLHPVLKDGAVDPELRLRLLDLVDVISDLFSDDAEATLCVLNERSLRRIEASRDL